MKRVLILFVLLLITSFAFADTTPPVTTFSSFQVPNKTDQNITLTCTDNNSGCKAINYNINNEGWDEYNYSINLNNTYSLTDNNVYSTNSRSFVLKETYYFPNDNNSVSFINSAKIKLAVDATLSDYSSSAKLIYYYSDGTSSSSDTVTKWGERPEMQYVEYNFNTLSNNLKKLDYVELYIVRGGASSYTGVYAFAKDLIMDINYGKYSSENNYSFIYSGAGSHSIQYYSTDNSDNTETTKTSNFTTYGKIRFNIYDENTGTTLTGVTINDGTTDYSTGANYYYDFNLQGTTTGTYTFALTKTGYSTRYYTTDLNQYSKIDINFSLIPQDSSKSIEFRFYKPDQTTPYTNVYITAAKSPQGFVLSRLKTDATGLVTFNLDQNATGITFDMNNGENTYQAVLLTINRPKSETTLLDIPENWGYEISGLASYIDSNVSTNTKVFAIYSNTVSSYSIQISSASITPEYTPRKYDVQIIGDQNTYTLQPYLINTEVSVTTTLYTINAYTNQAISDVTIKIYRNLPVTGRTLIEQTITDAKGQSIVYLILNQTYSFEISIGETIIRTETYTITATSAGIWFKIDPGYVFETKPALNNVLAYWTPGKNWLGESDANISTKIEYQTAVSNTRTVSSVRITCDNDGNELFQDNFSNPTVPFTQTYDFNLITKTINSVNFDGNYPITCLTRITLNDGNVIEATQTYVVRNDSPQQNLGFNLRPVFGCTATNDPNIPCPSMIFFALLATMMLTAGIMIESGFTQPEFAGILFFVGLGFFTFFTWIPPFLYVVALVIALLVYVALGVRRI